MASAEKKWREDRIQYYKRVEPTEAPRDQEPYIPPASQRPKKLRLEREASDRMWELLLCDDEINELKEATEHGKNLAASKSSDAEAMMQADDIADALLKIHMDDEYVEGNRLCKSRIWVDTKGPAIQGHTK